jgi:hypothetical protein
MPEFESTRDEKPPKSQMSVVYDPRTGRIVYVHEFIGDGTGLSGSGGRKDRERIALEGVRRHHKDAKPLRVMHLPRNFRFEAETLYRVDPRANKLKARKPQGSKTKGLR